MRSNLSRSLLVLALVVLFPAMLAAASAPDADLRSGISADAPSKVCHPKKPITCRADAFPLSTDVTVELPAADLKQAGLCFGPRVLCGAGTDAFNPSELLLEAIEPEPVKDQAGLCFGPRVLCGAGTDALNASDLSIEQIEEPAQQAGLCFGPRVLCGAGTDALNASDLWIEQLEEPVQQAGLCFGPRVLCKAQNLS